MSLGNAEAIASLNPKDEFPAAGKFYYYIVDEDGDHQGALVPKEGTAPDADVQVLPMCTEVASASAKPLMVKITYDSTKVSSDPLSAFTITTSWTFKADKSGHIDSCEDWTI